MFGGCLLHEKRSEEQAIALGFVWCGHATLKVAKNNMENMESMDAVSQLRFKQRISLKCFSKVTDSEAPMATKS